jgi:hypothetical protein
MVCVWDETGIEPCFPMTAQIIYWSHGSPTYFLLRSLVNVHSSPQIGKEQCIVFFHILNSRRLGKRVPTTLPGSLRTSFLGSSNYALSENYSADEIRQQAGRPSVPLSFATKSAFSSEKGHAIAGSYLNRLDQKDQAANGKKPFILSHSLSPCCLKWQSFFSRMILNIPHRYALC